MSGIQKNFFNKILSFVNRDIVFFSVLFSATALCFRTAFGIGFFTDDFYFLKIGKIQSVMDFIRFFYPNKGIFYRPLSTETFFSIINFLGNSIFFSHLMVFIIFFAGVYYLYRSVLFLSKNKLFSKISVFLYSLSFVHVFQLYQLGPGVEEVMLFAFLCISFYYLLIKNYPASILFFILALLSKETAVLFPVFLMMAVFANRSILKSNKKIIIAYSVIALVFVLIFKYGVKSVTSIPIYQIHFQPRLIFNNLMWYTLWAVGFPSVLPDYFVSIFQKPIPKFWEFFRLFDFKLYTYLFITYLIMFAGSLIIFIGFNKKYFRKIVYYAIAGFVCFVLFISPTLPIIHKWMVRLTISLIFISLFEAYVICLMIKNKRTIFPVLATILLIIYTIWNIYAKNVHEMTSTYLFENQIFLSVRQNLLVNKNRIIKHRFLFFKDKSGVNGPWAGSEKLKSSLSDQHFLDYYFPGEKITAVYGFENKKIPQDSFVINAWELVK